MFGWARKLLGYDARPMGTPTRPPVQARFDNAQTSDDTTRAWWMADYFSAKAANNYQVRRQLRTRSRYEVSNNPYLFGICNNNADDLIGTTGPTLQVLTKDPAYNRAVQAAWSEWADEVALVEKLRTTKLARTVDGEGFLILKTVEDLFSSVKLYPLDVEADQVTTLAPTNLEQLWVDGLDLHPVTGRPVAYHVLRYHPGDWYFPATNPYKTDRIKARHVIHWFPRFRPGQVRGVPVFTSALDLFNELRAFRKAVLAKANIAANLTAVLESEAPAATGGLADADGAAVTNSPFSTVPIDRGVMTELPFGFKLHPFESAEPSTTYEMFQEKCLGEACRPLNYPLNMALGTSQKFNFSSAKLDHINYYAALTVERSQCDAVACNPLFAAWFEEAVRVPGLLPSAPRGQGLRAPPREWHWPGYPSIDPESDARTAIARINGGIDTWREFWASRGYDWRDVMAQQDQEQKEIEKLGLTFGEPLRKSEKIDGDEPGKPGAEEAKGKKKKPGAAKAARPFRAGWDEADHPRDEHGRFGEGGEGAHQETHDEWEKENAKIDDRYDAAVEKLQGREAKETEKMEARHEKENDQLERDRTKTEAAREKEDAQLERTRAKEEREVEQKEAREEKETAKSLKESRAKEDKEADVAYAQESRRIEKVWGREDEALQKQRDKEDEGEEPGEEKVAEREAEDAQIDWGREQEEGARETAHEEAQQARDDRRFDEDNARQEARDEAEAKRFEAWVQDDKAIGQRREEEDRQFAEREKALEEKQAGEYREMTERYQKEQAEIDEELNDLRRAAYERREKDHPEAHKEFYSPRQHASKGVEAAYDPDQPRDEAGKWGEGEGGGAAGAKKDLARPDRASVLVDGRTQKRLESAHEALADIASPRPGAERAAEAHAAAGDRVKHLKRAMVADNEKLDRHGAPLPLVQKHDAALTAAAKALDRRAAEYGAAAKALGEHLDRAKGRKGGASAGERAGDVQEAHDLKAELEHARIELGFAEDNATSYDPDTRVGAAYRRAAKAILKRLRDEGKAHAD